MDERFRVIDGGETPRPEANPGGVEQWICRLCELEIGVATSTIVKVKLSPMIEGGKIVGGSDVWACADCLARGRLTQVTT